MNEVHLVFLILAPRSEMAGVGMEWEAGHMAHRSRAALFPPLSLLAFLPLSLSHGSIRHSHSFSRRVKRTPASMVHWHSRWNHLAETCNLNSVQCPNPFFRNRLIFSQFRQHLNSADRESATISDIQSPGILLKYGDTNSRE